MNYSDGSGIAFKVKFKSMVRGSIGSSIQYGGDTSLGQTGLNLTCDLA